MQSHRRVSHPSSHPMDVHWSSEYKQNSLVSETEKLYRLDSPCLNINFSTITFSRWFYSLFFAVSNSRSENDDDLCKYRVDYKVYTYMPLKLCWWLSTKRNCNYWMAKFLVHYSNEGKRVVVLRLAVNNLSAAIFRIRLRNIPETVTNLYYTTLFCRKHFKEGFA